MNRRDLLSGVAGLAGGHLLSPNACGFEAARNAFAQDSPAPAGSRSTPSHPVKLQGSELEVLIDPRDGLPCSYFYRGRRLWGELKGVAPCAILCRLAPRAYQPVLLRAPHIERTAASAVFTFTADFAQTPAVSFRLKYTVEGASLTLTMEDVREEPGFELIELALPQLIAAREQDGPAWFAEGRHGGSFVKLEDAKAYRFEDDEYFGRISTELPIGMVGQGGIGCVMEVTACMDGTETEIKGASGQRCATLGTVQVHRVHGGRCYRMNDGGDPVCGNADTPNLLVEQASCSRFDFFSCADVGHPWLIGAKIVRSRVPSNPTNYFSDRFLYILAGKNKTMPEPRTTFAQSRQIVRDMAMLTDNAPQTVFLSGWAYDGQDTGFPSEDKINASLGNYEELRDLIEAAKPLNANVTLNVNYDDAYKSSPIFNEAFIARRPDGQLWKSRAWDGEDSYIVGMAKFVEGGWAGRRIAYTMDRYKIENSLLIDAMSWFAIRNDWDRRHPASGYKNLVDGKYKIIEQFRARSVAVTSEQLRYPFIGRLPVTMDGPGKSSCPFGGEAVPLIAAVYRGAAIWGTNSGLGNEPGSQLLWNTRSALWFQADSDRTKMAEFYYLVVLPYAKLHALAMEGYESGASTLRVQLERNSHVQLDASSGSYSATCDGTEIARDDATFCPIDEHRIAFYSRHARQLTCPLPKAWQADRIRARALSLEGRRSHQAQCANGMISVRVEAGQPVIVYSDESRIPSAANL
jgi:hypothetical protein